MNLSTFRPSPNPHPVSPFDLPTPVLQLLTYITTATTLPRPAEPPQTNFNATTLLTGTIRSSHSSENHIVTSYVLNQCAFPIYITSAYCCPTCTTTISELSSNSTTGHWNMIRAFNDGCAQTVKLSRTSDFSGEIYQIEYNIVDGVVWYNLSAVNGDPFWEVARFLEIHGETCEWMYCPPGERDGSCNWPTLGDCSVSAGNDVMFYLC